MIEAVGGGLQGEAVIIMSNVTISYLLDDVAGVLALLKQPLAESFENLDLMESQRLLRLQRLAIQSAALKLDPEGRLALAAKVAAETDSLSINLSKK